MERGKWGKGGEAKGEETNEQRSIACLVNGTGRGITRTQHRERSNKTGREREMEKGEN